MTENCFICEEPLGDRESKTVKSRGILTLIDRSIARGRKDHEELLLSVSEIKLHIACYKNYSNPKILKNLQSRRSRDCVNAEDILNTFNFMENCFVCGKKITYESARPNSLVTKPCFQVTIMNALTNCKDELGKQIFDRIKDVPDLIAVGARYHRDCVKLLYSFNHPYEPATKAKKKTELIDKAMKCIDSYFNEHYNEGQFKLTELINCIDLDYVPSRGTIKERLLEIYGDDVLYFDHEHKETIVRFRGYEIESETEEDVIEKRPKKPLKSCKCIEKCKSRFCACRKANVMCSTACTNCEGESCTNSVNYSCSDSSDEDNIKFERFSRAIRNAENIKLEKSDSESNPDDTEEDYQPGPSVRRSKRRRKN
ncbi:uncharacterized protein LOC129907479 [Episyrphus balteatus]|uniref:uncharacterized protein LOC129907479 n=1 Tax=Episyrphus balteatus TaxID=286459 RepID=UPI0024863E1B|nr:uncharacterized protein LOC129907479 [Episyrphus balteatus]XP_055839712.1 uncharacterized protein LOC129907479 [Episyrphus balteatus]